MTTPELLIDTPDPEIAQVTVSLADTEPSAVTPSLTALTMLLVIVGGASIETLPLPLVTAVPGFPEVSLKAIL